MASAFITYKEFVEISGVAPERLQEILALGWIETSGEGEECSFCDADIYKVRKLERLCVDLDLPVVGGTIIVDLLERVDTLERTVRRLQGLEE
ncbi:MAG: chaperone modulator CbpM [Desulfovibrio sp.]|jgi:chaperone modulatory protein CbpM|nr:chaperone modulator CbpM [Desulfovibrio sp.]